MSNEMQPSSVRKQFSASLDSLAPVRDFLSEHGTNAGLTKQQVYKLCLAVDEVVSNIIMYGYANTHIQNPTITVSFTKEDSHITVITEDEAIPFNPLEKTLPQQEELSLPMEERSIGGLGIMLAIQNVNDFSYTFKDGKNRNKFVILLSPHN